jgi:hypothetical protein
MKLKHMSIGGDVLDFLFGKETFRFKQFLKSHGSEEIKSIKVSRQPISKTINLGMDLISNGLFSKAKNNLGIDNFFHLGLIINDKYFLEKNETVNQRQPSHSSDEETIDVDLKENITIDELIKRASDKYGNKFWGEYKALENNCQAWVKMTLSASNLYSQSTSNFTDQNAERLITELPSYSLHVANTITDIGAIINKILQITTGGYLGFQTGGVLSDDIGSNNIGKRRKNHLRPKIKRFIR